MPWRRSSALRPWPRARCNISVYANNLSSFYNASTGQVFQTEVGGLTISSPLIGDPALGTVNPQAIGLFADNSDLLIDRDYFINAGVGMQVVTSGSGSTAPTIENDVFVGNNHGVVIQDAGSSSTGTTTNVINNTFAYNTDGVVALNQASTGSEQALIANNIFWDNHDLTSAGNGAGIISTVANKLYLYSNMFLGNGPSSAGNSAAAINIGNGFNPAYLGPNASNAAENQGNYTGYPAFVVSLRPAARFRRRGLVLARCQFRAALDLSRDQQLARERGNHDRPPG